jgi:hypothetical protein
MKVYVVNYEPLEQLRYDTYAHCIGVFSNREKAVECLKNFIKKDTDYVCYDVDLETLEKGYHNNIEVFKGELENYDLSYVLSISEMVLDLGGNE